jgi:2-oxo-4-hydroxy-4-carboxy-5-ureidoimidazoline decarboxylase
VELARLNALEEDEFLAHFGTVFEHSPWVAQRAWQRRPFSSFEALHAAMMTEVREAQREEQLSLVRAHPELAGREAREGALTADSSAEQARLGLAALSSEQFQAIAELNRSYRRKFSFPCIVALRLHASRDSVMSEMRRRLANDAATELRNALEQIGHITRGRLGL